MNSKERVLIAIKRDKPDRVPFDMSFSPSVLERIYRQNNTSHYKRIMERYDLDIIDIRGIIDPLWIGDFPKVEVKKSSERYNYLGWTTKVMFTSHGEVEEHCGYVLENAETMEDLEKFRWPKADWFDFSNMNSELEEYKEYCVMASGSSVFQHPALVRRLDNLLCDMAAEPEMAHYIMDKYTDFYVGYFSRMLEACKGTIDILRVADDLGMQDRMLINENMFDEFIAPKLKRIVDMAHSYGTLVMFHSCGSIVGYIDKLIGIGVDILDPVQITAKDMDPKGLNQKFGDKICFHGAVDTQYVLPTGNERDIEENVRNVIEAFGRDGGFILAPSHSIQPDVPLVNIDSLHKAYLRYR